MKGTDLKVNLYIANVEVDGYYSKSLRLEPLTESQIHISTKNFGIGYEQYIAQILSYYEKDPHVLEAKLGVESLANMGTYIRGLFGGENKKGKTKYAGLVIEETLSNDPHRDIQKIRLFNTSSDLEIDRNEYKKHRYILIYRGITHPFYHSNLYIILGAQSKKELILFLKHLVAINSHILARDDREKIESLLKEIQFPTKLQIMQQGRWYVLYRNNGTFSSVVVNPDTDTCITESHMAYMDCGKNREEAYYYCAVLNYLAYKASKLGMSFVRDQFSRPILAIIDAELSRNDVDKKVVNEVAELSIKMHEEAKSLFEENDLGQEKKAFELLKKTNTFNAILRKLDSVSSEAKVSSALTWVAGKAKEQKKVKHTKKTGTDKQRTLKGT